MGQNQTKFYSKLAGNFAHSALTAMSNLFLPFQCLHGNTSTMAVVITEMRVVDAEMMVANAK